MYYRLVRRFRARVKTQEIVLLCITLAFALVFGCGAGIWYQDAGREYWLISSINTMGGASDVVPASVDTNPVGDEEQISYDFFAALRSDDSSGFFASPRAGQLQPANVYSASLLTLSGHENIDSGSSDDTRNADDEGMRSPDSAEADEVPDRYASASENGALADSAATGNGAAAAASPDFGDGAVVDSQEPGRGRDAVASSPESDRDAAAGAETGENPTDSAPDQPVYTVKVIYYGDRHVLQTVSKKVSDLFNEHNIHLTEDDKMTGAYLDGIINSDLYIEITRVTTKTIVEEVKIQAKIAYRDNPELTSGQSKVIRNAVDGLKRVEYLLTYENGIQVSKKAVKEEVINEAVSGIIEQGASGTRIGKGGVEFTYSKVIDVKCTAYNSDYESTGKRPGDPDYGITKSGMVAREGVVAVDPSVIPLHTKMYIEILDEGIEDYGFAVAGDTGGKIKGKKVDLYFDKSHSELMQFGVRKARVYILD